jgi:hypothetical protein
MLTLPPVAPPCWWRFTTRLGRDHYVRVDSNDYSIDPSVIGRSVLVQVGNEQVSAYCGSTLVARHARCWARHQTITDPQHAHAARRLRAAVGQFTPAARPGGLDVEQRDLTVYDRIFTVIDGGAGKEQA